MNELEFEDLDKYLLQKKGKIIHQVWFGTIPNKKEAAKAFEKMRIYRDSWIMQNPNWYYMCWNLENCNKLVRTFYPEHLNMYNKYIYPIQKCDTVRYLILHRYGGVYADMDYYCNKPLDEVFQIYKNDIYFVETPNRINSNQIHISNSLMYSKPNHPFWRFLFIDLERNKKAPYYYSRHVAIMFTTGPGILNRVFNKYKFRYSLGFLPYKKFHPCGLTDDIVSLKNNKNIYAMHIGKGSWEKNDSKIIIFLYREYKLLLFIILIMLLPQFISKLF